MKNNLKEQEVLGWTTLVIYIAIIVIAYLIGTII